MRRSQHLRVPVHPARDESLSVIASAETEELRPACRVIVAGCLAIATGENMYRPPPGIDRDSRRQRPDAIAQAVMVPGRNKNHAQSPAGPARPIPSDPAGCRLTPSHTAYLRFPKAAISGAPSARSQAIRGPFRSKPSRNPGGGGGNCSADGAVGS